MFSADYKVLQASNDLMEVNLFSYPYDVCKEKYRDSKFKSSFDGRQICAGRLSGGADTCRVSSFNATFGKRCNYRVNNCID